MLGLHYVIQSGNITSKGVGFIMLKSSSVFSSVEPEINKFYALLPEQLDAEIKKVFAQFAPLCGTNIS